MNKVLLRQIQTTILKSPQNFDMSDFEGSVNCQTTACIAGWACKIIDGYVYPPPPLPFVTASERGARHLQLSADEAEKLFYHGNWPQDYSRAYDVALYTEDSAKGAQIAVDLIEEIIQNGFWKTE